MFVKFFATRRLNKWKHGKKGFSQTSKAFNQPLRFSLMLEKVDGCQRLCFIISYRWPLLISTEYIATPPRKGNTFRCYSCKISCNLPSHNSPAAKQFSKLWSIFPTFSTGWWDILTALVVTYCSKVNRDIFLNPFQNRRIKPDKSSKVENQSICVWF